MIQLDFCRLKNAKTENILVGGEFVRRPDFEYVSPELFGRIFSNFADKSHIDKK